jgi:mevalonate pyrophosphate decarboxylase
MDENIINHNCDANLQKIITMFLDYFRNQFKRKHDLQLEAKNKRKKKTKT